MCLNILPYFKSNLCNKRKERLRLDTTYMVKGTNTLVIYTISKAKDVVVLLLLELVSLGISLTSMDQGVLLPGAKNCDFARD